MIDAYSLSIMEGTSVLSFIRLFLLYLCLLIAAKSDFTKFMVKDKHWILFSPFAIILLFLDLIFLKSSLWNFFMIFVLISAAVTSLRIIPNIKNLNKFNLINYLISSCYILGFIGIVGGLVNYTEINYDSLILGTESKDVMLWWSLLSTTLLIYFYIFVWKYGLIQGGADIKALIWTTLLIPSWTFLPQPYIYSTSYINKEEIIFQLPPSLVLFIWGSSIFIILPIIFLIINVLENNITSISDMKVAWHAKKIPLSEVLGNKFWILSELILNDDKEFVALKNRLLPNIETEYLPLEDRIKMFEKYNITDVWVTTKHPFVGYLFFAIFPLILFGDPTAIMLAII